MRYFIKKPLPSPLLTLPVLHYAKQGTGGQGQPLYGQPEKLFCRLCEHRNASRDSGRRIAGSAYFSGQAQIFAGDVLQLPDGRRLEVFSVRIYRLRDGAAHHLRAVLTSCPS